MKSKNMSETKTAAEVLAPEPVRPVYDPLKITPLPNRILRLPAVREATGLSTTRIYELMRLEMFPKSFSLGARAVGWRAKDVDQWCEDRYQAAQPPQKLSA